MYWTCMTYISHMGSYEEFCFRGIMPRSHVKIDRRFGRIYRLHLEELVKRESSMKQAV
jgi:hypothetical protein